MSTTVTATTPVTFEEGKKTVDSLIQLTPKYEPFDKEEEGLFALGLAREIDYKIGEAKALNKLGILYRTEHKEGEAFDHIKRAKAIFDKHGSESDKMDALLSLTEVYRFFFYYKEALDYGKQTMVLAETLKDSLVMGKVLWSTATVHLKIHQKDKYFELGEQALAIFKNIGNTAEIVNAYTRLGCIMDDYDKRFKYFSEAEKILPKIENVSVRENRKLTLYLFIATAYVDKKDYAKAEAPTRAALQIAEEIGNADVAANMHEYLAKIQFYYYRNYQKAIEHGKHHLQYEKSIGRYYYVIPTAQFLKEIYTAAGQPEKALEYADIAMLYQDSIYWANRKDDAAEIEKAYELEKKYSEIQKLETQRRTRTIFGIGGTAFFLLLTAFFYRQRQLKNRHIKVQEKLNRQLRKEKATIEKQKKQLARINASKNQLFAIIAHDMRNAVYNFRGVTDKIHYFINKKQPERIDEFGDQIEISVNNLTGLMNNLLTWAMAQKDAIPYQPENIEVKKIAEHVFKSFADRAKRKNINLKIEVPENTMVYADRNALSTILRNIVGNSLKYTEKGEVVISSAQENGSTKIIVIDEGKGMSQEQLKKLFVIDQNKSRRGTMGEKGSGIGLVLVKELVEMNKGGVEVESEEGKGTAFTLNMPTWQKQI